MCKITKCHFNIDCDARQLTKYERLAFELCLPSFDSVSIAKSIRKGYEFLKLKSCQVKDDPFFVTVRNDVLAIEYENTYNLLFISRLVPQKGLMDALRIMLAINESSKGTVQLHVIGDGPQRILGEQYCKDYNINCVTFYGFRTDLNRFFERCDGIMKVSHGEPANSVVREALYSGKRVFSTIESPTDIELADSRLLIAIDRNSPEVTALDILDCLKADRLDSKHQETIRKLFSTIYSVDSAKAFYLNLIKCQ
jgi:glycosyltransferase involved in cell wall biosynthesis